MADTKEKVPRRIAGILLNSLKGGVVPRQGLPYVTVGRENEIRALLYDLERIEDGGASFRFVVGRYGAGKSFLLQTIRNNAMGNDFVVADADLSPERRLQGTGGQGLATYRELIKNLSTKSVRDGSALSLILDKWISSRKMQAEDLLEEDDERNVDDITYDLIRGEAKKLEGLVHGYDFARLLIMYYDASEGGDDDVRSSVLKWFSGEYRTKTEAKNELGVNCIISDEDWYDYLKVFAEFFVGAGYKGLIVLIDELVNLYQIPNPTSRQYNYEKILAMYNDTLQGRAKHLGIIMSGTPTSVEDRRRGLFSYEALRSRLQQGYFAGGQYVDLLSPVLKLQPLTPEEMLVLSGKLADIHAGYFRYDRTLTDEDLLAFIQVEHSRVGASKLITPREVIRDFIEALDILYQNPELSFGELLGDDMLSHAALPGDPEEPQGGGMFAEFEI